MECNQFDQLQLQSPYVPPMHVVAEQQLMNKTEINSSKQVSDRKKFSLEIM
jgi:hypothetical protein